MWPILFDHGPLVLHTYGAFVALGFFLGYRMMLSLARRRGVDDAAVSDLAWICLLSGLVGARLFYVAFNWRTYQLYPLDVLKVWEGGLVWYGGLIAAAVAGTLWARRRGLSAALMADLAAPGVALGHALGRLGCFAAGCCYGKPCSLPWAATFRHPKTLAPAGVPLHPAQMYEAALDFLLFFALFAWLRRRPDQAGTGRPAVLYVVLYSLIRLGVEFFRADDRGPVAGGLTATQWIAAAMFLAAVLLLPFSRRRDA